MKHILLITTGGTIACVPTDEGLVPRLTGEDLLEKIPRVKDVCKASSVELMNIDSSNILLGDWKKIAIKIYEVFADYDGIVITHGTDTMAYTAAMLSFLLQNLNKPVILTGSQMPISHQNGDGPKNLLHAFQAAISDLSGVFVVFGGKIINGCRASKMYSKRFDAFISRNFPYAGRIKEQTLILNRSFPKCHGEIKLYENFCEYVFLLKLIPGMKSDIITFLIEKGYKGIVIEGFGVGGIPYLNSDFLHVIEQAIAKYQIPIVIITQCPYDGVNLKVYDVGLRIDKAGTIAGCDMTTEVAVTKLMWVLGQTRNLKQIKEMMRTNYCDEITE
ncbi:MAG: asparaginase [Clostridiales bacterium]|nr:asparaginase [Clostridiales bacterium]